MFGKACVNLSARILLYYKLTVQFSFIVVVGILFVCFCLHIFFILNFAFSSLGLYLSRCDYYWIPWKPQICVAEEMKHLIGTQKTCAVLMVHFLLLLQCAKLLFLWKEINVSATSAQAGCAVTELFVLSKNAETVWTY